MLRHNTFKVRLNIEKAKEAKQLALENEATRNTVVQKVIDILQQNDTHPIVEQPSDINPCFQETSVPTNRWMRANVLAKREVAAKREEISQAHEKFIATLVEKVHAGIANGGQVIEEHTSALPIFVSSNQWQNISAKIQLQNQRAKIEEGKEINKKAQEIINASPELTPYINLKITQQFK